MYTHIYMSPSGHPNVLHTKNIHRPVGQCHISVQKYIGSPAYQNGLHNTYIHQGASIAPPTTPPSGGDGGPPPPAPGGGGGTSAGPPFPGDRRPLVIAASTATRRTRPRHGGGKPIHCSRNPLSWIQIHMSSSTSCNTSTSTYLDGRTPPQEATPCPGPPGSPPQHRGTEV
jgi:hypothetical protein